MNKTRVILTTIVGLLLVGRVVALPDNFENSIPQKIIIKGIIKDKNRTPTAKIFLRTYKTYFKGIGFMDSKNFIIPCSDSDSFKVELEAPVTGYFYIEYSQSDKALNSSFYRPDNIYLLNTGDSVFCELGLDNIVFKGKGAEKLNCQAKIFKARYISTNLEEQLQQEKKYMDYFLLQRSILDSILKVQIGILNEYKRVLNLSEYNTIYFDCIGMAFYTQLSILRRVPINADNTYVLSAKEFFNKVYKKSDKFSAWNSNDQLALVRAPHYVDFLLYKEIFDLELRNEQLIKENFDFKDLYDKLKTKYSGVLRDKLIASAFISLVKKHNNAFNELSDAENIVKYTVYKDILDRLDNSQRTGATAYKFELQDSTGNVVKIDDLKNKVLIIHFWFYGCQPCIVMTKQLEQITKYYENNADVLFVAINVDKNKNTWIKGLHEEKYTGLKDLNLYTNGLGFDHPIMNYYNYNGCPQLLIVDKNGLVVSANPPRPSNDIKTQALLNIINSSL